MATAGDGTATAGESHDLGADGSLPGRPDDLPGRQASDVGHGWRVHVGAPIHLANDDAHQAARYGHAEANHPGHPDAVADADADREGHADQSGVPDADQFGHTDRDASADRHADAVAVLARKLKLDGPGKPGPAAERGIARLPAARARPRLSGCGLASPAGRLGSGSCPT